MTAKTRTKANKPEKSEKPEKTGGSTPSQYELTVSTLDGSVQIECGEIIDALDLNFNLGEAFKACWRLETKDGPKYNLNKMAWFVDRERLRRGFISQKEFWERNGSKS